MIVLRGVSTGTTLFAPCCLFVFNMTRVDTAASRLHASSNSKINLYRERCVLCVIFADTRRDVIGQLPTSARASDAQSDVSPTDFGY